MKKLIMLSGVVLALSACTTMNFSKNGEVGDLAKSSMRHHAVLGLVEIQEPVNLKDYCANGEAINVRTQTAPINALINWVAGSFVGGLYSQKTVSVSCK